jgi:hypothetical protein
MDESMLPLDPHHLEVLLGAPKTISEPIARMAQTVPLSYVKICTISKWAETSFYLTQVSKTIFEPMVRLSQTVHLSWVHNLAYSVKIRTLSAIAKLLTIACSLTLIKGARQLRL